MKNYKINSNKYAEILEEIEFLQKLINDSFSPLHHYKMLDIISGNELNITISSLEKLFITLSNITLNINTNIDLDIEAIIKVINEIKNELILLFSKSGSGNLNDLLKLIFGDKYTTNVLDSNYYKSKYSAINNYCKPVNIKILNWKHNTNKKSNKDIIHKNRIIDDSTIIESADMLECFDLSRNNKNFHIKVYGISVTIHDNKNQKTYLFSCLIDDVLLTCVNNSFIKEKLKVLNLEKPKDNEFNNENWKNFFNYLSLKDLLVYSNTELYNRYMSYLNQLQLVKQKNISQIVNEFLNSELYIQRNIIIQLLIKTHDNEFQYLSYLLYDLLSNDNQGTIDTLEQTILYDSLPWNCKLHFKDAMKRTINYTNYLSNFDTSKIPLEQQICLMKVSDNVKEKAMLKLKEVKAKSDDTGSKARQYLDGLLKIPFGVYKEEYILTIKNDINYTFTKFLETISSHSGEIIFDIYDKKEIYTNIEILKIINYIKNNYITEIIDDIKNSITNSYSDKKKSELVNAISIINNIISNNKLKYDKITTSNKKNSELLENFKKFIDHNIDNKDIINVLIKSLHINNNKNHVNYEYILYINETTKVLEEKINEICKYIDNITYTLNDAVYGHDKAKRQIETIIGQWINGEKNGYCFGFEGPPGVGKTSLAKKGISNCLKDINNESRKFSLIAIGGSSNGSTLEGHNYTYVGSTWGKIVDILIENKCMNPIIFIDELDKISKTEHGKEIIGILTHLIDSTQNDGFQDKYFNGIELDLSKALFIFSYNDVELIDRILLDRIHRIKFKHLSLDEKIIITNKYILPEIYKKMGLENIIFLSDEVLIKLINNYTCEHGVRKLKEILFEIIGEINLSILKSKDTNITFPIIVSYEDIKNEYLKDRREISIKNVNDIDKMGVINGLWANSVGQGGLLHIEVKLIPSTNLFDLKLTGMQGDVMKESMNVAKTLAVSLVKDKENINFNEFSDKYKNNGFHIHVPEGATPKDGPSAGAAITTAIYSCLTEQKIRKDFAITGEICLQGNVTAIGGLDLKILGGIKAGAKNFIYPKENEKDFSDFYKKYKDKEILNNINFFQVDNIYEVLELLIVK